MRKQFLSQAVTLWPAVSYSDSYGEVKLTEAEEIKGRWEDAIYLVQNLEDTSYPIVADVFVEEAVNVPCGSIVFKGTKEQWQADRKPLYQVDMVELIPDIKGRSSTKVIRLKKFNDTLPAVIA